MRSLSRYKIMGALIPIMVLVLFCGESSAIQYRNKGVKMSTQSYPWAFQIALDGQPGDNAENDGIQGIRFSLKRHTSKSTAYRFNLGFLGHEEYYNDYDLLHNDDISIKFDNGRKFEFTGVNLSAQYLYYPSPDKKFQIFWGAGPRLSINEADPDAVYIYNNDWYYAVECNSSTRLGLGAEASLGAEWFLGSNLSLLAEWGVTLQNEWYLFELDYYSDYYHYVNEVEAVNDGLHLDASWLKLGVSFYF